MTSTSAFAAPTAVLTRNFANLQKEIVDNITQEELDTYRSWGAIDKAPTMPFFDDVKHQVSIDVPIYAKIPTRLCNVDRSYDRDVNWSNVKKFLLDTRGFSYDSCQAIEVIWVRSLNIFIVIIGQHRVIMCASALGFDADIPAKIRLLDETLSEAEQIIAESKIHHREANQTTAQKPHERGNSGYIAGDSKSVENVNFCASLNLGVKGTEHLFPHENFKKTVESPWAIGNARKIAKDSPRDLEFGMLLLRDYLDGNKIDGKSIVAVTQYLVYFHDQLKSTAENNSMSKEEFVEDVFDFAFNKQMNTTDDWLSGTQMFRGEATVIPVARLIKLTNLYCRAHKMKIADGRKKTNKSKWVTVTDKVWEKFLIITKTPDILATIPNSILTQI